MHKAIAGDNFPAKGVGIPGRQGHPAARLLHQQPARRHIPGFEPQFVKNVKTPASHIGQIDGRRANAPHPLGRWQEEAQTLKHLGQFPADIIGKTCGTQALLQLAFPADGNGIPITEGSLPAHSPEAFVHHGDVDDPERHTAITPQGHGRAHLRDAMYKVCRPVHGINNPAVPRGTRPGPAALFRQKTHARHQRRKTLPEKVLHGQIRPRYQIDAALVPHMAFFQPLPPHNLAALAHKGDNLLKERSLHRRFLQNGHVSGHVACAV